MEGKGLPLYKWWLACLVIFAFVFITVIFNKGLPSAAIAVSGLGALYSRLLLPPPLSMSSGVDAIPSPVLFA